MAVIVDTSVWIDYLRGGAEAVKLDSLIDEDLIVINELILAELVPFLKIQNQRRVITLLYDVNRLSLSVHWAQIIEYQFKCLKKGLSGIGIPDLIIAQNAIQHHCELYSLDNHFGLMKDILGFKLLDYTF